MALSKRSNGYQAALYSGNIGGPPKIKCSRCDIVKGPTSFSNKRLLDLKAELSRNPKLNPATAGFVPCSSCTGAQRLDHTCSDCGKTKSTETGFTKTQLKKGDDALCIKCSNTLQAMGPGGKDGARDLVNVSGGESSDESNYDSEDSNPNGGSVLASGVTGRSTSTGGTFPSAWGMAASTTMTTKTWSGGGVPIGSAASSSAGGATRPASSAASTLTTPSTFGRPTGLPATFNTTAYGRAGSSVAGSSQSRNPGFAKIRKSDVPAYKKKEKQQSSSEDEDDDDEIIDSGSDWEEKNDLLHGI